MSQFKSLGLNHEMRNSLFRDTEDTTNQIKRLVSRYCIKIDEFALWSRERCDKGISIESSELEDGSALSDSLFNATRGFYLIKIWNSGNHLIFLLKN